MTSVIERLRALHEAATAAPWCPCTDADHCSAVTSNGMVISFHLTPGTAHANARRREDGELIAEMRNALPRLLRVCEAAMAVRDTVTNMNDLAFCGDEMIELAEALRELNEERNAL